MSQTITAVFENGVLNPTVPLDLPDRAQVLVTVELLEEDQSKRQKASLQALENLWRQSKINSQGERLTRDQLHERR